MKRATKSWWFWGITRAAADVGDNENIDLKQMAVDFYSANVEFLPVQWYSLVSYVCDHKQCHLLQKCLVPDMKLAEHTRMFSSLRSDHIFFFFLGFADACDASNLKLVRFQAWTWTPRWSRSSQSRLVLRSTESLVCKACNVNAPSAASRPPVSPIWPTSTSVKSLSCTKVNLCLAY